MDEDIENIFSPSFDGGDFDGASTGDSTSTGTLPTSGSSMTLSSPMRKSDPISNLYKLGLFVEKDGSKGDKITSCTSCS